MIGHLREMPLRWRSGRLFEAPFWRRLRYTLFGGRLRIGDLPWCRAIWDRED